MKNRKNHLLPLACAALLCAVSILAGCADATGLHNLKSSQVTFVFKNFTAAEDGDYSLPGSYQETQWDNTETMIALKGGAGTSSAQTVGTTYITFTLVKTGSWTRAWYPSVTGNAADGSIYQNFYADSIPMGKDVTITVDGGTSPAKITVE
jgi:hypothetical protein